MCEPNGPYFPSCWTDGTRYSSPNLFSLSLLLLVTVFMDEFSKSNFPSSFTPLGLFFRIQPLFLSPLLLDKFLIHLTLLTKLYQTNFLKAEIHSQSSQFSPRQSHFLFDAQTHFHSVEFFTKISFLVLAATSLRFLINFLRQFQFFSLQQLQTDSSFSYQNNCIFVLAANFSDSSHVRAELNNLRNWSRWRRSVRYWM